MSSQNKFTKSVLERLEQEQQKQKTAPPVQAPVKQEPTPAAEPKSKKKTVTKKEPAAKPTPLVEPERPGVPDLSAFLPQSPERVAKNKTFYLDEEVIDALHQAAKSQKMTDSRLANEILRTVLGLG